MTSSPQLPQLSFQGTPSTDPCSPLRSPQPAPRSPWSRLLKSIKYLICTRYKWLIIKIVLALLGLLMLALFLYSLPGYMVKKLIGA